MAGPGATRGGLLFLKLAAGGALLAALVVCLYLLATPEPAGPSDPSTEGAAANPAGPASNPGRADVADASAVKNLVGDAACVECHAGQSEKHNGSGHSRTLSPAPLTAVADWLDGRKVVDPDDPSATWTYAVAGGRLEAEREEQGRFHCFELEFAVGSGGRATSFVTTRPPASPGGGAAGLEHRLTYLADGPKMVVTPGQVTAAESTLLSSTVGPHGRVLDEADLFKCFGCHATAVGGGAGGGGAVRPLRPNVNCERCHGPGRDHVEAARRGAPPADLAMPHGSKAGSPVSQVNLCGECHRRLDSVPPAEVDPKNVTLARFQPLGIQLSACFQHGASGMSCTTCHDSHAKVEHDVKSYESTCLGCHNPLKKSICPVSPGEGCLDCHMPKRAVSEGMEFRDHWIRVPAKTAPARETAAP